MGKKFVELETGVCFARKERFYGIKLGAIYCHLRFGHVRFLRYEFCP